jgi:hypothetical protein
VGRAAVPQSLDEVRQFFATLSAPGVEADKFYHHYQSNGWKVGGRTTMRDWHASARKWLLNTAALNADAAVKAVDTSAPRSKNYGSPL